MAASDGGGRNLNAADRTVFYAGPPVMTELDLPVCDKCDDGERVSVFCLDCQETFCDPCWADEEEVCFFADLFFFFFFWPVYRAQAYVSVMIFRRLAE